VHLDHIPQILASLAGSAVGAFVVAVVVDDALGVILALRQRAFDWHKLPSFLESQFGTKQAFVLLGLIAATYFAGGDVKQAALAALAAGGGAMTAAVAADVVSKIKRLVESLTPAANPKAAPAKP